jgi:hypothetical protein
MYAQDHVGDATGRTNVNRSLLNTSYVRRYAVGYLERATIDVRDIVIRMNADFVLYPVRFDVHIRNVL